MINVDFELYLTKLVITIYLFMDLHFTIVMCLTIIVKLKNL